MLKFLVVLLVVGIGVWSLVTKLRGPRQDRPPAPRGAGAAPAPTEMVACAHCGVHLPAADAVADAVAGGTRLYCSDAHRRLGPAQPPA